MRRLVQMRLPVELVEWTDAYASGRGSTRTAVVVAALEGLREDAGRSVPDLPVELERAGMRVLWQCESDPFCQRVLARHWPGVACYPDVSELRGGRC